MRREAKITFARRLRKEMTKPEVWLWVRIRGNHDGIIFRKQHPIGPYILDFYCVKAKLAIEVDGVTHTRDSQIEYDKHRMNGWLKAESMFTE